MKNKLVKRNMTKFDYRARKLGFLGLAIIGISLSVGLPIANSLSKMNSNLTQEIVVMQNEQTDENHQYTVERK